LLYNDKIRTFADRTFHPIEMQQENKTLWFDNLRAIATVAVIGIHVSSDYAPASGTIPAYDFWIGNIFDSASRFAVPMFVMLSGALLLSKDYEIGTFLKKRLVRLLIPFLFWSLIYIAFSFVIEFRSGNRLSFEEMARTTFVDLRDGSSLHLWYVYMIIGLYLFVPIIGKWVRNSTEKEIGYFLLVWVCVMIADQPIFERIRPEIDMRYFGGYLGYLVLGHYLRIKSAGSQGRTNALALICIALGLLSTILGTYGVHWYYNEYVSTFYEPLSPNILLYSGGLFLWFKNKDISLPALVWVRNFISKYSYGIFLAHVLILSKLHDFNICWNFINPILGIPVTILLCLIVTSAVVSLVSKLPLGKYISG
jgi:surface polysaccharide O-acyltransferase-like enzyme